MVPTVPGARGDHDFSAVAHAAEDSAPGYGRLLELLAQSKSEIAQLKSELARRDVELSQRDAEIAALKKFAEDSEYRCSEATATGEVLSHRVAELERSRDLNSKNSSKPPSSDGLKKPKAEPKGRNTSLREKSGRKTGGQRGHKGKTLLRSATPDKVVNHWPEACKGCGEALGRSAQSGDPAARQVFDLPEPRMEVTEHLAHACRCARCGDETRAMFPEGVNAPTQYGVLATSVAVYLRHCHLVPEKRLADIFADLFGMPISKGTIGAMVKKAAANADAVADGLFAQLAGDATAVKHLDETGCRVEGSLRWAHVLCSEGLTHLRMDDKRGNVPQGMEGIVVHDCWVPYFKMDPDRLTHALCNAHLLRELVAVVELCEEKWAARMLDLLKQALRVAKLAKSKEREVPDSMRQKIAESYQAILDDAIELHEGMPAYAPAAGTGKKKKGRKKRRKGHNLALRMREHSAKVLLFLNNLDVPFTNNEGERALRMLKVALKIMGCFRTRQGAKDFANLRSVCDSGRKQNLNMLDTIADLITKPPDAVLAKLTAWP